MNIMSISRHRMPADVARPDSLRSQIYDVIRERIQRGEIGSGERLVDSEIASSLGTSRMPAREALMQLVNEGYLVSTTRGFMLPELASEDIKEIFEVRRLLEPRAAASAARNLLPKSRLALSNAVEQAEEAVSAHDAEQLMLANVAFRQAWLTRVPNRRLAATILRFSDQVRIVRAGTLASPIVQEVVLSGLRQLRDAFLEGEFASVHDRMNAFIVSAEELFFALNKDAPSQRG
jgi:DNA-binding GntR family transcriptional regulator